MVEFKIGMTVKRVGHPYNEMDVGDIDVIERIPGPRSISLKRFGTGHSPKSLIPYFTSWRERYE